MRLTSGVCVTASSRVDRLFCDGETISVVRWWHNFCLVCNNAGEGGSCQALEEACKARMQIRAEGELQSPVLSQAFPGTLRRQPCVPTATPCCACY